MFDIDVFELLRFVQSFLGSSNFVTMRLFLCSVHLGSKPQHCTAAALIGKGVKMECCRALLLAARTGVVVQFGFDFPISRSGAIFGVGTRGLYLEDKTALFVPLRDFESKAFACSCGIHS